MDFYLGAAVNSEDVNATITRADFRDDSGASDSLDRLRQVVRAAGSSLQNRSLFTYDDTNRIVSRSYSDSTPAVFFYYDSQSLPTGSPSFSRGSSKGRLVATLFGGSDSSTGSYLGYDSLGRSTISFQKTDSQLYQFGYAYNLAGNRASQSYPSGKIIQTDYDSAARIAGVKNLACGSVFLLDMVNA